jgi:hypothetical protein
MLVSFYSWPVSLIFNHFIGVIVKNKNNFASTILGLSVTGVSLAAQALAVPFFNDSSSTPLQPTATSLPPGGVSQGAAVLLLGGILFMGGAAAISMWWKNGFGCCWDQRSNLSEEAPLLPASADNNDDFSSPSEVATSEVNSDASSLQTPLPVLKVNNDIQQKFYTLAYDVNVKSSRSTSLCQDRDEETGSPSSISPSIPISSVRKSN